MAEEEFEGCPQCGQPKALRSEREAVRVAAYQICSKRTALALRIYRCPAGEGWHLTKNGVPSRRHRFINERGTK